VANAHGFGASPDFSITMLTGGSPDFTWSPSNSSSAFGGTAIGGQAFYTSTNAPLPLMGLTLTTLPSFSGPPFPDFPIPFDGSVSTLTLEALFPEGGSAFYGGPGCDTGGVACFTVGLQGSLTTAEVSPVPLPDALPLFGSGVIALAGMAWRSRGKVSSINNAG
jgi:hypothetical protein